MKRGRGASQDGGGGAFTPDHHHRGGYNTNNANEKDDDPVAAALDALESCAHRASVPDYVRLRALAQFAAAVAADPYDGTYSAQRRAAADGAVDCLAALLRAPGAGVGGAISGGGELASRVPGAAAAALSALLQHSAAVGERLALGQAAATTLAGGAPLNPVQQALGAAAARAALSLPSQHQRHHQQQSFYVASDASAARLVPTLADLAGGRAGADAAEAAVDAMSALCSYSRAGQLAVLSALVARLLNAHAVAGAGGGGGSGSSPALLLERLRHGPGGSLVAALDDAVERLGELRPDDDEEGEGEDGGERQDGPPEDNDAANATSEDAEAAGWSRLFDACAVAAGAALASASSSAAVAEAAALAGTVAAADARCASLLLSGGAASGNLAVSPALPVLVAALVSPRSTLAARDAAAGAIWQLLRRRADAAEAALVEAAAGAGGANGSFSAASANNLTADDLNRWIAGGSSGSVSSTPSLAELVPPLVALIERAERDEEEEDAALEQQQQQDRPAANLVTRQPSATAAAMMMGVSPSLLARRSASPSPYGGAVPASPAWAAERVRSPVVADLLRAASEELPELDGLPPAAAVNKGGEGEGEGNGGPRPGTSAYFRFAHGARMASSASPPGEDGNGDGGRGGAAVENAEEAALLLRLLVRLDEGARDAAGERGAAERDGEGGGGGGGGGDAGRGRGRRGGAAEQKPCVIM